MNNVKPVVRSARQKLKREAPMIATGLAVTSATISVFMAAKGGIKAQKIISQMEKEEITKKEVFKATWHCFLPSALFLTVSVYSIIYLNKLDARRLASVTSLYALSEKAFTEYKEKVEEKLSKEEHEKIISEISQEKVKSNPPKETVVLVGNDVLFMDSYSGRYFTSTVENVRKAMNDVNSGIFDSMYASLTDFYDELGLEPTAISDDVGWNVDNMLDVKFSSTITPDNRPCIVLDYAIDPVHNFSRFA